MAMKPVHPSCKCISTLGIYIGSIDNVACVYSSLRQLLSPRKYHVSSTEGGGTVRGISRPESILFFLLLPIK